MIFNKVVIWGYPLHSHTHSYIHSSFKKAFDYLGYQTLWLTDKDNISNINFDNCLFITAGEQEKNIPLNKTSTYILHNVDAKKYLDHDCKIFVIQVHTKNIPSDTSPNCKRINKYTLLETNNNIHCLYMPWATDLLPHEIDLNQATNQTNNKYCFWAGTYGDSTGIYQNGTELMPFFDECKKNNILLKAINPWSKPISDEENRSLVKNSYLAPAIQGPWQINNHYLPCRIFKNISYGHFGITNNIHVNNIFDNQLIYDSNPITLFYKSLEFKQNLQAVEYIKNLMQEVKNNHTYINRIKIIFECMGLNL